MFRALAVSLLCCSCSFAAEVFHPSIAWSAFLAAGAGTVHTALDSQSNIYLYTNIDTSQLPPCPSPPCRDETPTRQNDLYIAKLTPDGTRILWQRFIGGGGQDFAFSVAVAPSGDVFLSGNTNSTDFPLTKNALPVVFQPSDNTFTIGFLMRLNTDGVTQYSTFVEGFYGPMLPAANGEVWFAGTSKSPLLTATTGALDLGGDPYIARLSADGSRVVFSLHGISGSLIAQDAAGNLVVAGSASGPVFNGPPLTDIHPTPGAFQTTVISGLCGGFFAFPCSHQFVSKVSADGSTLLFSTYVTGYQELPQALAVDGDGNILLAGYTQTSDYPTTPGAIQPSFGGPVIYGPHGGLESSNGYVTKLAADGGSLLWSTFLGSNSTGFVSDLKIAADGTVYVAAYLKLNDFPQLGTAGKCGPGPIVAAIRADGTAFVGARSLPLAFGYPAAGLLNGVLALDGAGSLVFAASGVQRSFAVSPQTASINPDPTRISNGVMLTKLDLTRAGSPAETACVVDGANLLARPVIAPGELLALFADSGLGAHQPLATSPDGGRYPSLAGGTQVLFDGIPAPLLYTAPDQTNAVAPYEIAGRTSTVITVIQDGVTVHQRVMPVASRAPAFLMPLDKGGNQCTINGDTTIGLPVMAGVIVNPDGTQNSCDRPAHLGDIVEFYLTGLGAAPTAPPDGVTYGDPAPPFTLPLKLQINQTDAPIESITGVPGWVSGLWKLRARIPAVIPYSMAVFRVTIDGVVAEPQSFFAWVQR
jgi:uncharacterized protein (TIGR03437 family)